MPTPKRFYCKCLGVGILFDMIVICEFLERNPAVSESEIV